MSALRDDIKKGCAEESYLSFVLNYKGKLYTEIFLKRLIVGRVTVFEKNLQSSKVTWHKEIQRRQRKRAILAKENRKWKNKNSQGFYT